jgi:hypothetical protein
MLPARFFLASLFDICFFFSTCITTSKFSIRSIERKTDAKTDAKIHVVQSLLTVTTKRRVTLIPIPNCKGRSRPDAISSLVVRSFSTITHTVQSSKLQTAFSTPANETSISKALSTSSLQFGQGRRALLFQQNCLIESTVNLHCPQKQLQPKNSA